MLPRRKEISPVVTCLLAIVLTTLPGPSEASSEYFYGGHLSAVDGSVWIQSAYDSELSTAELNLLVEEGTSIVTARDGRAEVQLSGSHILRLWHNTEVDFVGVEGPVEIWMNVGSVHVRTTPEQGEGYVQKIVTPASTVYVTGGTVLRIDVETGDRTRVTVLEGNAEVVSDDASVFLQSRQMATVAAARIYGPLRLTTSPGDGFARWCSDREEVLAAPLDPVAPRVDVPAVGELDAYGSWVYVPDLSVRVWRPRVAIGWSPYSHGRWTWSVRYGLFWVSNEPWGWIPYHYGSWSWYASCGWVWVPGGAWHGARVSWVVSGGYIGWRPLLYSPNHITVHIPTKQHPYYFVHRSSITDRHTRSVQLDSNHLARHRTIVLKDPNSIVRPPSRVRKAPERPTVSGGYGDRRAKRTPAAAGYAYDQGSRGSRNGFQDRSFGERYADKRSTTTDQAKIGVARYGRDADMKTTGPSRRPDSERRATVSAKNTATRSRKQPGAVASSSPRNSSLRVPASGSKSLTSAKQKIGRRNTPSYGSMSANITAKSLDQRNSSARALSSRTKTSENRGSPEMPGNTVAPKKRVSGSRSTDSLRASTQRGRR